MFPKRLQGCMFLLILLISNSSGINPVGDNIDSSSDFAAIVQSKQAKQVRLCSVDHQLLKSLAGTDVEVMLAVPNEQLELIAEFQEEADLWVAANVVTFLPATKITHIVVGNDVPAAALGSAVLLVPAMRHLHSALAAARLDDRVTVSSPVSRVALAPEWSTVMAHLLQFLNETGSPFFLKSHPSEAVDATVEAVCSVMQALNFSGIAVIAAGAEELAVGGTVVYYSYVQGRSDEGKRRSLATGGTFCVALPNANQAKLLDGLNWACGPGHADCTAIQPGGPCYKQNDVAAMASYAYNDYYHRNANTGATCSFNGTATTTTTDPSTDQCVFAGSTRAGGSNSSTTPSANPPGLSPPTAFGNGSFGPSSTLNPLNPLNGGYSALSVARWKPYVLLMLPLFIL